jgi:hypothetical protein
MSTQSGPTGSVGSWTDRPSLRLHVPLGRVVPINNIEPTRPPGSAKRCVSRADEGTAARMSVDWSRGATSEVGATMALMVTLADRIVDAIRFAPLDDDVAAIWA